MGGLDNLPLQLTRFIGREQELAQIRNLLRVERLVTLIGTGGVGKTRLALETAAEMREAYPDGVWLVELDSVAEPTLVPLAVATPLGVRSESHTPPLDGLVDFLRPRQLLLVLDNCEHLLKACAELAAALLKACPRLQILATSREPLRVAGEKAWRVPSLKLDGSVSPSQVLESEAVRLFADRASAVAGLAVTERDAPALMQVCQRLDGIPLAIELAAGRVGVLSVEQIATRLDDRFRLLVGRCRTTAPRHKTLRATLDWSYDLLSAAERDLLCRNSVFTGGWTLEAAEAVCAGDGMESVDVLEYLSGLVDKSLVVAELGVDGRARYRLLESVRQYAQERMRAIQNATDAVRRRHCAYYRQLAEAVETHIVWTAGGAGWLTRLDPELGNLRSALRWSLSAVGDVDLGLDLAAHLGHFWYTRGDRGEGRAWLQQLLTRAPRSISPARAWATLWAGGLAHGQSQYDEAVPLLEEALDAFIVMDDKRGVGWALSYLGYVARARAEFARAEALLHQSVAALRAIGDELSLILPLAAQAFAAGALGDATRATMLLEESVAIASKTGSRGRLALVSIYLGQVRYAEGDMPRAAAAFTQGLELSREWGSAWSMAECLEGLALVAGASGKSLRAARMLGAAARLREPIGASVHPVDGADHAQIVARISGALGNAGFAAEWAIGKAMDLAQTIEYALGPDTPQPVGARIETVVATPGRLVSGDREVFRLTTREREVAGLIARGLSNREIAETLVVALRTASNHVEHILDKLGFHSRSQIAAWATQHRLVLAEHLHTQAA